MRSRNTCWADMYRQKLRDDERQLSEGWLGADTNPKQPISTPKRYQEFARSGTWNTKNLIKYIKYIKSSLPKYLTWVQISLQTLGLLGLKTWGFKKSDLQIYSFVGNCVDSCICLNRFCANLTGGRSPSRKLAGWVHSSNSRTKSNLADFFLTSSRDTLTTPRLVSSLVFSTLISSP